MIRQCQCPIGRQDAPFDILEPDLVRKVIDQYPQEPALSMQGLRTCLDPLFQFVTVSFQFFAYALVFGHAGQQFTVESFQLPGSLDDDAKNRVP